MLKSLLLLILSIIFTFSAFASEIIAVYPEHFPPFFYKQPNGETKGLGIDVMEKVAQKTGLDIKFTPVSDWKKAIDMVKKGEAQMILNIGMTDERSEFMRYSVPIDTSDISLITRKTSHIKSTADLKSEVVATLSFSVAHTIMKEREDITLITSDDPGGLMYLLMSGQADAIIYATEPAYLLIRTMSLSKEIHVVEPPIASIKRAVGITATDTNLYFTINNALSDFTSTDEYREIYDRWHKPVSHDDIDTLYLKIFLGISVSLIVIMFVWRFNSVKRKNTELQKAYDNLKQTQNALSESELKFSSMAENIGDIIWFADSSLTKVLYVNKAYERIYGKTTQSLYDDPWSYLECIHPDDVEMLTLKSKGAMDARRNIKYRVINKQTGKTYWLLSQYQPIAEKNGQVQFVCGIISDITPVVEAENEKVMHQQVVAQQSKFASLGEMIGSISHQWRQPLNTVYLCMQMLQETLEDDEPDKEAAEKYIADSMKLIEHMSETIDDFRDFFKTNKKLEPFDAPRTVQHILRMISPQLKSHKINFHLDCRCSLRSFSCVNNFDPGNPPCRNLINGIANEFKHAVLNLIQNAKEALILSGKPQKDIFISMKSENGQFIISIADNAGGIPADFISKIFDAYITGKEDGTGMGLYMTKTIIEEKMNGTVTAENTETGAKFTITLPVIEIKEKPQP